jgi:tripartite-type tricarboxylate transporter receptor subunit TctC
LDFLRKLIKEEAKMKTCVRKTRISALFISGLVIALLVFNLPLVKAGSYPEKPIKLVAATNAGGGLDRDARGILPYLQKHLPVPIIMVYKPGAGSRIGNDFTFTSPPDGYTIGIISLPGNIVGELMFKTKYKINEFTHIYAWARMNNTLFVNSESWKTFDEFVKDARSRRIALGLGAGLGSTPHLTGLLIAEGLGVDFKWVPFASAAPAVSALVGKHIDAALFVSKSGLPLVEAGKIRPLLVMADSPDPAFPEVPTPKMLGYKIATQPLLRGIVAPPGLPKDRAKILENALEKAAKDPKFMEWGKKQGLFQVDYHPKEFAAAIDEIYRDVRTILKRLK